MKTPGRVRAPKRIRSINGFYGDDGIFETKQKALMFCAAVGVHIDEREPLTAPDSGIRWGTFSSRGDDYFLQALGLYENEGLEILAGEDEDGETYVQIFEEYANAGLKYIEDRVVNTSTGLFEGLIDLMTEARKSNEKPPSGLEGASRDALEAIGL